MEGSSHHAHMPVWGRVTPGLSATAAVLLIDNDFSFLLGYDDYTGYYADALAAAGIPFDYYDADARFNRPSSLPDVAVLTQYRAIIIYTGDHYQANGAFTVATPLTAADENKLTEYANQGGVIIAMGQDLASVLASAATDGGTFFYSAVLGGNYLRDSVSGNVLPSRPVVPHTAAPAALAGMSLDLSQVLLNSDKMAGVVSLLGANEVPPAATVMSGTASLDYTISTRALNFSVTVNVSNPVTVTASHIHTGTAGVNGGVLYTLFSTPTYVTDTLTFTGTVVITTAHEALLINGGAYINVHTSDFPGGEVRGQTSLTNIQVLDGAANQAYVDELYHLPDTRAENPAALAPGYVPLLTYPSASNMDQGIVAMAHREQPSLENPGTSYKGRSIYTSFGLEGVNNSRSTVSRSDLLKGFLFWGMDEPTVVISDVTPAGNASALTMFQANITNGVSYRWDFGDGTAFYGPIASATVGHVYATCGSYTVRVEATNAWGNVALASQTVEVTQCPTASEYRLYLPGLLK